MVKIFTVMILSKNGKGEALYESIKNSFEGSMITLVDDIARAQKLLRTIAYQIIVCDLDFGEEGFKFFQDRKAQNHSVKTVLLSQGDFASNCPEEITGDELKFIEAVDCTWQMPVAVERIMGTINGLLQKRDGRVLIDNLPFIDRIESVSI